VERKIQEDNAMYISGKIQTTTTTIVISRELSEGCQEEEPIGYGFKKPSKYQLECG
jgi:hypothetical protein